MEVSVSGMTTTVTVHGEIDIATARDVEERAAVLLRQPVQRLNLDLRGVPLVDSVGLAALVRISRHASATDCTVSLVNVQPAVRRVLEVTGLTAALNVEQKGRPG
jgi:anti-sigma B factor antagonist/stage II sporulation protein AA (anti-sigma F factor antagonist)